MNHEEKKKQLKKIQHWRRGIEGILFIVSLVLAITFMNLRESSKTVAGSGWLAETKYDTGYSLCGVISWIMALVFFAVFVTDLILCRVRAVQAGSSWILFCQGLFSTTLYVDGNEVDSGFFYCYHLQGYLADGTKAIVSISYRGFSATISFSNGQPDVRV